MAKHNDFIRMMLRSSCNTIGIDGVIEELAQICLEASNKHKRNGEAELERYWDGLADDLSLIAIDIKEPADA